MAVLLFASPVFAGTRPSDPFLRGYAQAILDRQFTTLELTVTKADTDGAITVTAPECIATGDRNAVTRELGAAGRIKTIGWALPCDNQAAAQPELTAPPPREASRHNLGKRSLQALPPRPLFHKLQADPREARFSMAYQYHRVDGRDFNAAAVSFGEYLGFAEGRAGKSRYQVGIQGAVFALFNFDTPSNDLVNADYWVGIPVTFRQGAWSARARIYHQSSHLGDEYLLRNPDVHRINLSYEAADIVLSHEHKGFRFYGGGGYVIASEPTLRPWQAHEGLEYRHEDILGAADLILAADFKQFQEQDWDTNQSYRAGLEFQRNDRRIAFMVEHYKGHSPNGQFYTREIQYDGIGMYFGF